MKPDNLPSFFTKFLSPTEQTNFVPRVHPLYRRAYPAWDTLPHVYIVLLRYDQVRAQRSRHLESRLFSIRELLLTLDIFPYILGFDIFAPTMLRLTKFMCDLVPSFIVKTYDLWFQGKRTRSRSRCFGNEAHAIVARVISRHSPSWGYACIIARR